MRYGIVGSRSRTDRGTVDAFISNLPADSVIVSGGAKGIDTFAEDAAKKNGLKCVVYRPNFKGAKNYYQVCDKYYSRNKKIVENSDIIVAFVSASRTGGTENTIKIAQKMEKPVQIIPPALVR